MAAVVASKPAGTATKMKKPSVHIQTNTATGKPGLPSSSPSIAAKKPPGQSQPQNSASTASASGSASARPSRSRLQRLSTRTVTSESLSSDKKATWSPEPYVSTEKHILKKYKHKSPSLIVHLHPTYFRFDQQDGSFSYHSEMRVFIEHLQKKTIPHDMLEEFRKSDVRFYDGWLIVRVIDHKLAAAETTGSGGVNDDDKPFSIHNYNQYITPSPFAPYPTKEQQAARSPNMKQERNNSVPAPGKENVPNGVHSDDITEAAPKAKKPEPKIFYVALRPTNLSKHVDLMLDAIAPDPKSKKTAANNARTPASAAPQTPLGTLPSTPGAERPPPAKKQKLRIDPKDHLEYEARVVNATAPPLYLNPAENIDEMEQIMKALEDPLCLEPPPSPKSRKRTVAELAADDAHAKEQERFMLIMDTRGSGTGTTANAGGVDNQAGTVPFQPRFEKFNALDNIKREIAEKKQREKDRQIQEDEQRRNQQQQHHEEERRRMLQEQMAAERKKRAMLAHQQSRAAQQAAQQQPQGTRPQPNGIPPQMQNQMMAQASSPIIRQGTPQNASSPIVNSGRPMVRNGSQSATAAGSPPRPPSALQHGHPGAGMARQVSNQEDPSRNGTPQIPHSTPGMVAATPVIRQGTPSQHMSQASPQGSMVMSTPQMNPGMMQTQMPNGMMRAQLNPQQLAELQRRQQIAQQTAAMQQMNGGQGPNAAQMAHMQANHQAQLDRQNALRQQQQQQQQQQAAMQQGNPPNQAMSPTPQAQQAYNAQVAEQMKARMALLQQQGQGQGSPGPNQMSPQQIAQIQQQMAQHMQQQQQQQKQQTPQMGQVQPQQRQMNPQMQQQVHNLQQRIFSQLMAQEAQKYGNNPSAIPQQVRQQMAAAARGQAMKNLARAQMQQNQQQQAMMQRMAQQQQQQQQQQQGGQMHPNMTPNMNSNMAVAMQQQQQHQHAQQIQAMQMQNAQNMIAQQQYQQQMQHILQQQQQQGQR